MKSLLKNYINLLTLDKAKEFALNNNINLTSSELEYLLNLIKSNYEDILENDTKYLNDLKNKLNPLEYEKIKNIYIHYKNKYKNFLF